MKKELAFIIKAISILTLVLVFITTFLYVLGSQFKTTSEVVFNNVGKYKTVPKSLINNNVIYSFKGSLTGYGPDCNGCSGKTATGYDVRNGNIYYYDEYYGLVRIIAADNKFKKGTIIKITNDKISDSPLLAIVLDRGGLIKDNKIDLLYSTEEEALPIGLQRDVLYEVLRNGW